MRILTEASGSLVAGYLIKAIQDAGHEAVGSDIHHEHAGVKLADDFVLVPRKDDPLLWEKLLKLMIDSRVDVVIPSVDETLLGWAQRRDEFNNRGIQVIVSPAETVAICQDKWETYHFFKACGIPCPEASLEQDYPLVKPRFGRGSQGVGIPAGPVDMTGMLSQQVATGVEFTIDTFFDREGEPVYIVPRRRLGVQAGKSTAGIVQLHPGMEDCIRTMARHLRFTGPINFQCFLDGEQLSFIEINPRIAGGMALGFAATESWINMIVANLIEDRPVAPGPVRDGLKMVRYYAEYFIS